MFNRSRAYDVVDQGRRSDIGPDLHGVLARRTGSVDGSRNSTTLRAVFTDSEGLVPAGSMSLAGLRDGQPLNDLISHLRQTTCVQ